MTAGACLPSACRTAVSWPSTWLVTGRWSSRGSFWWHRGATVTSRHACPMPRRPVRFLAFHGTADPLVPYGGGPIGPWDGWPNAAAHGGGAKGAGGPRGRRADRRGLRGLGRPGARPVVEALPAVAGDFAVDRVRWADPLGSWTTLYRVRGGGHTWPGGAGLSALPHHRAGGASARCNGHPARLRRRHPAERPRQRKAGLAPLPCTAWPTRCLPVCS